jgi:hypothetical protein
MLRAIGKDKRSSAETREKHRTNAIRQNALNAEWEEKHREIPSPVVFKKEILPLTRAVPVRVLVAASGLSESACKKIRAGDVVPHPRQWSRFKAVSE